LVALGELEVQDSRDKLDLKDHRVLRVHPGPKVQQEIAVRLVFVVWTGY
jgi:hypothetical protein